MEEVFEDGDFTAEQNWIEAAQQKPELVALIGEMAISDGEAPVL